MASSLVVDWPCALKILGFTLGTILEMRGSSPRGVGQSVRECVVKALRDVKVTGSKPAGTKNPSMLRVGVAQAGCDPRVILTA
jgi:hypothetical protein